MSQALLFHSGGRSIQMHAQEIDSTAAGTATTRHPAILLLHGSGGHADFWTTRLGSVLRESNIGFYAPHYFDRTGTARADLATITDGVHVPLWLETLDAALHFVASRPTVDPERIVLAGISLGAFLALAFAAQLSSAQDLTGPRRVRALLDISGGLTPPYDALASAAMPPTLILHGAADNVVPVSFAHDLDRILSRLNVPHRTEILPGEGHWFSAAAFPRMLLAVSSFVQEQLQ